MNAGMIETREELATFFIATCSLYNDGLGPSESHSLQFLVILKWTASADAIQLLGPSRLTTAPAHHPDRKIWKVG